MTWDELDKLNLLLFGYNLPLKITVEVYHAILNFDRELDWLPFVYMPMRGFKRIKRMDAVCLPEVLGSMYRKRVDALGVDAMPETVVQALQLGDYVAITDTTNYPVVEVSWFEVERNHE